MIDINKLELGRYVEPDSGCRFFVLKKSVDCEEYLNMLGFFMIDYIDQDYILSINNTRYNAYIILNIP
jgi:hypothetical protein